ncbi:MAG: hypothetical protein IJ309_02060 [Clostridia bacterium]|nr:hypothetical protein [Clostridia bacterium]
MIQIYVDYDSNYYIEIKSKAPELKASSPDVVKILCSTFKDFSHEYEQVERDERVDVIEDYVNRYNKEITRGSFCSWLSYNGERLVPCQPPKDSSISPCTSLSDDDINDERIIDAVEQHKRLVQRSKRWVVAYQNGRLCSPILVENGKINGVDEAVYLKERGYKSPQYFDEKASAINAFYDAKSKGSKPKKSNVTLTQAYFYKSHKPYKTSLNDLDALHIQIYKDFAAEEFMAPNSTGGFEFTEKYTGFVNAVKEAYGTVAYKPDSFYFGYGSLEELFFEYMYSHEAVRQSGLSYRVDDRVYCFATREQFVNALLNSDDRTDYIKIFNTDTVRSSFFEGYDCVEALGLTSLVYDVTGEFFYVDENGSYRFGKDFVASLSQKDELVSVREAFAKSIIGNYDLHEKLFNNVGYALDDCGQVGYEYLCLLRHALNRGAPFEYRGLSFYADESGLDYIRQIVRNAYRLHAATEEYNALITMLFDTRVLEAVFAGRFFNDGTSVEEWIGKLKSFINPMLEYPSLSAYLFSIDRQERTSLRELKFYYDNHLDTAHGHAKRLLQEVGNEGRLLDFANSRELKQVLEFIYGKDGYLRAVEDAEGAFDKMMKLHGQISTNLKKELTRAKTEISITKSTPTLTTSVAEPKPAEKKSISAQKPAEPKSATPKPTTPKPTTPKPTTPKNQSSGESSFSWEEILGKKKK